MRIQRGKRSTDNGQQTTDNLRQRRNRPAPQESRLHCRGCVHLALGIGANTASSAWSMPRRGPGPEPGQLRAVDLAQSGKASTLIGSATSLTPKPRASRWRARRLQWRRDDHRGRTAERVVAGAVTTDFFPLLGSSRLGRNFTREEDTPIAPRRHSRQQLLAADLAGRGRAGPTIIVERTKLHRRGHSSGALHTPNRFNFDSAGAGEKGGNLRDPWRRHDASESHCPIKTGVTFEQAQTEL